MRLIKANYEITPFDGEDILKRIELAARVCYKSEDKIEYTGKISGNGLTIIPGSEGTFAKSARPMVKKLISLGHEAMLEHGGLITVKFTVDRGVSHEIVRHRLFSFAQESTRYCDYSKDKFDNNITYIIPCWINIPEGIYTSNEIAKITSTSSVTDIIWFESMLEAEIHYKHLLLKGWQAQQARSILPNSLKTEIVVSGNPREWRHFFKLRTATAAHPQMREVAIPLLYEFQQQIPILFDDISI